MAGASQRSTDSEGMCPSGDGLGAELEQGAKRLRQKQHEQQEQQQEHLAAEALADLAASPERATVAQPFASAEESAHAKPEDQPAAKRRAYQEESPSPPGPPPLKPPDAYQASALGRAYHALQAPLVRPPARGAEAWYAPGGGPLGTPQPPGAVPRYACDGVHVQAGGRVQTGMGAGTGAGQTENEGRPSTSSNSWHGSWHEHQQQVQDAGARARARADVEEKFVKHVMCNYTPRAPGELPMKLWASVRQLQPTQLQPLLPSFSRTTSSS